MYLKQSQKKSSFSKKNIRIPEIILQSKSKHKSKSIHIQSNQSFQYGTDGKRPMRPATNCQAEELRAIMSSCQACKGRISEFTTKKPNHNHEKWTQTVSKPFLVDLIEERVQQICMQNDKLSKIVIEREAQISQRNQEINEIQDKFTNILYTLGQDYSYLKLMKTDLYSVKNQVQTNYQTPSYIKALLIQKN